MGEYDIPAAIDLVLGETGSEKLYYIGHSMGTTMFWVALNEHPELKDKIALMIGMGPVAKVKNMKSPLRFIAPYVHEADVSKHAIKVINKIVLIFSNLFFRFCSLTLPFPTKLTNLSK